MDISFDHWMGHLTLQITGQNLAFQSWHLCSNLVKHLIACFTLVSRDSARSLLPHLLSVVSFRKSISQVEEIFGDTNSAKQFRLRLKCLFCLVVG